MECLRPQALENEKARAIEDELKALHKTAAVRAFAPFIAAQRASGSWPMTSADSLLRRWKRDGRMKVCRAIERAIRRYLFAREKGATWAAPLSLLHLLSLEWLRDRAALWRFLAAFMKRCNVTASEPRCELRRRIAIHQNTAATGHSTVALQEILQKIGVFPKAEKERAHVSQLNLVKKHLSRDVSRARAKRVAPSVTK